MPLKENIKSALKRTALYSRYYPKFGRPDHSGAMHEYWLLDKINKIIDNNPGADREFFSGEYGSFIFDILDIAKTKSELQSDNWESTTKDFENRIKNASCNLLGSLQWKDLNFVACRFGLHRAGYAFRRKAIEYLYDAGVKNKSIDEICELFTAAMELGDYETAKYILDKRLRMGRELLRSVKNARLYFNMFYDRDAGLRLARRTYTKEDKEFAQYVKGKRIAVVGAAQPKEKPGSEIDSFDIVARIAYQGRDHIPEEYAGSRTSISYYCGWRSHKLADMAGKEFIYDLDYLIHKDPSIRLNAGNVKERSTYTFGFEFAGYYNMVQIAVMDLLLFDVKEIKIFNTNFHLSGEPYSKGFSAVMDHINFHDKDMILRAITIHDYITQISLIRNLWKGGLCRADNECEEILSMTNECIADLYSSYYPYTWLPQPD